MDSRSALYVNSLKMAHDKSINFVLPCDNQTKVTLILFTKVSNCDKLKQDAREGRVKACLLKNELIMSEFQVMAATNMAINASNTNSMKTRNLFTEIMYYMSCTRNITDSLNKFSAHDSDSSFLAVLIDDDDNNSNLNELISRVQGEPTSPHSHLSLLCDIEAVKKAYKIKDEEMKDDLLSSVVNRITTKEIFTF